MLKELPHTQNMAKAERLSTHSNKREDTCLGLLQKRCSIATFRSCLSIKHNSLAKKQLDMNSVSYSPNHQNMVKAHRMPIRNYEQQQKDIPFEITTNTTQGSYHNLTQTCIHLTEFERLKGVMEQQQNAFISSIKCRLVKGCILGCNEP